MANLGFVGSACKDVVEGESRMREVRYFGINGPCGRFHLNLVVPVQYIPPCYGSSIIKLLDFSPDWNCIKK